MSSKPKGSCTKSRVTNTSRCLWQSRALHAVPRLPHCCLLTCSLPTGHVHGVVVTVPEKTVNVKTGGNATLLCTYTSSQPLGNFFIQWSFYSAKESQLHTVRYLFITNIKFLKKLLHFVLLPSLKTQEAGNIHVPAFKTELQWNLGEMHQVSLGSQLLPAARTPAETYEKVPEGLERWTPCSKPQSVWWGAKFRCPTITQALLPWASSLFSCLADISFYCESCFPSETPLPMTLCSPT